LSEVFFKLYYTEVKPVDNYACAVWAADLRLTTQALSTPIEHVHTAFLRHLWGLRQSVSPRVLYAEHDRQPLIASWWKHILKFWKKLITAARPFELTCRCPGFRLWCTCNWSAGVIPLIQMLRPEFCLSERPLFDVLQHHKLYLSYIWSAVNDIAADPTRGRLHTYFKCFKPRKGRQSSHTHLCIFHFQT
jgi:hypothetical protein